MALAMFVCLLPVATKQASAGPYTVELTCYANSDNVQINGKAVSGSVGKSLRRGTYLKSDFNNITATKSGYDFLGWYTASSGGTRVTADNVENLYGSACPNQNGSLKIYAHWGRFVITSSGGGKIYPVGGSTNATLTSLYGHNWTVTMESISGGTWSNWLTKSFSGGYATFTTKSRNGGLYDRQARARFKDQYGNQYTMLITHMCIDSVFKTSSGSYTSRFKNVVSTAGSKPLNYNMGYTRWFINCCTDSAMMDLLNRRMTYDGYLRTNCYFDIRDILEGIAIGGYDASRMTVSSNGTLNTPGWNNTTEYTYDFPSGKTSVTTTFKNKYGTSGTPKSYSVTFEKVSGTAAANRIKTLLNSHPEGVFVYSNAGGPHALVIIGFESNAFWYVDNGAGTTGMIRFNKTCFAGSGHDNQSENGFINGIFRIAYVN